MKSIIRCRCVPVLFILSLLFINTVQAAKPLTFSLNRLENNLIKTVTEHSWENKYLLIAVGYTGCPDVCPTTLLDIRNALQALDDRPEKAAMIQPLFITIDPISDSLSDISRYAAYFDSRIVGLHTDSFDILDDVVKQLRAVYSYQYEGKPVTPPNLPSGYTVLHSTYIYLYSPEGMLVDAYPYNMEGKELAKRITKNLPE